MPRPPIPPEKRRRVARACDSCKRRKERCNGTHPCIICTRRRKEHECFFSNTPARFLRPAQSDPSPASNTPETVSKDAAIDTRHRQMAIDRLINSSVGQSSLDPAIDYTEDNRDLGSSATVPDHARLLRDPEGKFMYVGDSASLSFLQSVRRIVLLAHGECSFTVDPRRHTILETAPVQPMKPSTDHLPLNYESVKVLADQYLLATAGLVDLFNVGTFYAELEAWVNDPSRDLAEKSCLYYLVLAIGSQACYANSTPEVAEQYFSRGRQQAFYTFTEAPSLMTVQVYTLITVYMLGACRRNGAFMNFGIACRATFALGMHLHSTHSLFDEKESLERQSTWRSVRMLDIFFSASLGRPPATCDLAVPKDGVTWKSDDISEVARKVLSLSAIYDRIVIEVYMKKAVSTRLAEGISQQLRSWTQDMPEELDLSSFPAFDENRLAELIAATHIISAYHWAIILLTRPFLTSQIIQDMNRKANRANHSGTETEDDVAIKTFADACVASSLKGLDIVENLLKYKKLPGRLPFLINCVCNIALVLGAAVFADQDKNFPLEEGLGRSLKVLRHFTPHDPHASRYAEIIAYLSETVKDYISVRNRQSVEHRSREVSMLFGSVSHPKWADTNRQQTPTAQSDESAPGATMSGSTQDYDAATPVSFDKQHNDLTDFLAMGDSSNQLLDTIQPPSSVFEDGPLAFPDDAYLFMEQEPSIFSFWTGS